MVKVRARKFSQGAKLTEENGRIVKTIQVDNEFKNDTTTNGWLTENGKYILDNETHQPASSLKGPGGEYLIWRHTYNMSKEPEYGEWSGNPEQEMEPWMHKVEDPRIKAFKRRFLKAVNVGLRYQSIREFGDVATSVPMNAARINSGSVGKVTDVVDLVSPNINDLGSDDVYKTVLQWTRMPEDQKKKYGTFLNWWISNDTSQRGEKTFYDNFDSTEGWIRQDAYEEDDLGDAVNSSKFVANIVNQIWNSGFVKKIMSVPADKGMQLLEEYLMTVPMFRGLSIGLNVIDKIYDALCAVNYYKNWLVRGVKGNETTESRIKEDYRKEAEDLGLNVDNWRDWYEDFNHGN